VKKKINIPNLGDAEGVEVIEVCVKPGDTVGPNDPIIVLESDKAAMEIPASIGGQVVAISVKNGDTVEEGQAFVELEVTKSTKTKPAQEEAKKTTQIKPTQKKSSKNLKPIQLNDNQLPIDQTQSSNNKIYAGPAVRKLAREFGIDLNLVIPSGPKGRILKEDLHSFVKSQLNQEQTQSSLFSQPKIDFSKWGPIKEIELSRFQKTALENLHRSWINIPHVTQHDEIDISKMMNLKNSMEHSNKMKISPLAFIVKATILSLKKFPIMNSALSQDLNAYVMRKYFNIGIAVDTENGLIVPNIKNADKLSVLEISNQIKKLAKLSKTRKISPDDLNGSTFTISSLGGIGGKFFTPIINPPEVAILGISKSFTKVRISKSKPIELEILPISLSYDHRLINGVYAAQFIVELGNQLNQTNSLKR
tara:strand:- start:27252 stop:28511 length:1260 start_codon:yes stop_codon:yes gene_type:complete